MKRLIYILFAWLMVAGCEDKETEFVEKVSYDVADAELVIASSGKTTDYTFVTSNTEWNLTGGNEWCKVSPASGGAGTTKVYFELTDNENHSDRDVTFLLNVGGATTPIKVIQKKKDALTATKEKWEFDQDGGKVNIDVTTNIEYFVKIPATSSWITQDVVPASKGLETYGLTFTVAPNKNGEKRQGEIIIEDELRRFSDTIRVYQTQENQIILTANEYNVPLEGLGITVQMKNNVEFDWNIVYEGGDEGWIKEVPGTRSFSSSAVQFSIDETTAERRATITFTGKSMERPLTGTNSVEESITIIQRRMNVIIVSPERYSEVPQEGGMVEFEVQKNVDYEVILPERATWITEMPQTRALDKATFSLRVDVNPADKISREARILVKAKNVTNGLEEPVDTVYVRQQGRPRISEYKVLMALANALKESKNFNTNFGSWGDVDNPEDGKVTSEWRFIKLNEEGKVVGITLTANNLKGTFPPELGDLEYLETFSCWYSKDLTGDLPAELGNLKRLKKIDLQGEFTNLPDELGDLENLESLDIRSAATNEPTFIGGLTNLTTLELMCKYTGPVPAEVGRLKKLTSLILGSYAYPADYNNFTSLPAEIGQLENLTKLSIYGGFEGAAIPKEIGQLKKLTNIKINKTGFVSLPEEIGELNALTSLELSDNKFEAIPKEIGRLTSVTSLNLRNNNLSGSIPEEIVGMVNLRTLYLENNKLTGSVPAGLGQMEKLGTIELCSNQLSGNINFDWSGATSVYSIELQNNELEGEIPVSLLNLTTVSTLNLSDNRLSGELPKEVSWSTNEKLRDVYLQNNQLSGTLPEWLCSMKLTQLNLENNNFTGTIPAKLFGTGSNNFLTSTSRINLNGNRLSGDIPEAILIELRGNKRDKYWFIVDQQEGYKFSNWDYSK